MFAGTVSLDEFLDDYLLLHIPNLNQQRFLCVTSNSQDIGASAEELAEALARRASLSTLVFAGLDWSSQAALFDSFGRAVEAQLPRLSAHGARPARSAPSPEARLLALMSALDATATGHVCVLAIPRGACRADMLDSFAFLRGLLARSACCWVVVADENIYALQRMDAPFFSLFSPCLVDFSHNGQPVAECAGVAKETL